MHMRMRRGRWILGAPRVCVHARAPERAAAFVLSFTLVSVHTLAADGGGQARHLPGVKDVGIWLASPP